MSLPLAAFSDGFFIFGVMVLIVIVGALFVTGMVGGRAKAKREQPVRAPSDGPLREDDADTPGSVTDDGADVRLH